MSSLNISSNTPISQLLTLRRRLTLDRRLSGIRINGRKPVAVVACLREDVKTLPAKEATKKVIEMEAEYVLQTYMRVPVVIVRGKGCYLYDIEGREYLDMSSGIGVNALGHGDPDWVRAVIEQAKTLTHVSNLYHSVPPVELAKFLVACSFFERVFFTNSGTEATEAAIKFARKFQKHSNPDEKDPAVEFISFTNSFHGRTMGALALTSKEQYRSPFEPLMPGVTFVEYGNINATKEVLRRGKTAAVFVEPIQGEGGIHCATKEFLQQLRTACDEARALLVFDEVQCGLGRTGYLWAHESYGVFPDIMTLAKPLAGGLPIGAVLVTERVASAIKHGDHGSTFAGGPLISKAALTVLDKISQPSFLASVFKKGLYFKELLQQKLGGNSHVKEIRGHGLIIGIELDVPAKPLVDACRNSGLLVLTAGKGNVVRLLPPLIITEQELTHAAEILQSTIPVLDEGKPLDRRSSGISFNGRKPVAVSCLRDDMKVAEAKTSKEVIEVEAKVMVGTYARVPVVLISGKGCKSYDCEGREFLDMSSGIAVTALGHGDPDWVNTLVEEADKLTHISNHFYSVPQVELAKRLVDCSFANRAFFTNSGTETNEAAIKFARKFQRHSNPDEKDPATEFISFTNSFHGGTIGALALTSEEQYRSPFEPVMPGGTFVEYGNINATKEVIRRGKTAAVFVEPIQVEGGIHSATKEFLQYLRTACDEAGALLVFDEVQCGLGRTGYLWTHEAYGVFPDIMTLAEPLAGGLPMGVVLLTARVASAITYGDHGSTFAGGPLVSNAAITVLDKISQPSFLASVSKKGLYFKELLQQKLGGNSHVKEIRGLGLIIGIELDVPASPFVDACRNSGLLVFTAGKGNVVRLVPPLIITEQELTHAAEILQSTLPVLDESN